MKKIDTNEEIKEFNHKAINDLNSLLLLAVTHIHLFRTAWIKRIIELRIKKLETFNHPGLDQAHAYTSAEILKKFKEMHKNISRFIHD